MNESPYSPLLLICFVLNLLLGCFLLFIPSKNKKANSLLGLLLIMIALSTGGREAIPFFLSLKLSVLTDQLFEVNVFLFFFGPFLHLYISYVIDKNRKFSSLSLLHFVPAISIILLAGLHFPEIIISILSVLKILHVLAYSIVAIMRVKKVEREMQQIYSSFSKGNLRWIKWLVLWFLATFAYLALIGSIILLTEGRMSSFFSEDFTILIITIWIISFWYRGFRQPEILNLIDNEETVKYSHSGLNDERKRNHFDKMNDYLNNSQIFLDPDLTIKDLSDDLDIPLMELSQVINEIGQVGFFDYINRLRVEEFIKKIKNGEDEKVTILALAFDCGFNSKSAFYSAFKKVTGLSPGLYKKGLSSSS